MHELWAAGFPAANRLRYLRVELLKINDNTVPSSRCDPNRNNSGCDDQEIKYIEKIAATINGDTGRLKGELRRPQSAVSSARCRHLSCDYDCVLQNV